ncbi:hypothetical protein [uncultured Cohaesibacter sp.]|uniref:hypothetical protein n=1 Tax=uncultured Cohaesibacter sp. TaxID=1002546 RepID=UPI0029C6042B|nr:hypothetical protein [uncultured Cohaesibacter sp.]
MELFEGCTIGLAGIESQSVAESGDHIHLVLAMKAVDTPFDMLPEAGFVCTGFKSGETTDLLKPATGNKTAGFRRV